LVTPDDRRQRISGFHVPPNSCHPDRTIPALIAVVVAAV
jgi:hypothetical protein